jgi:hypothetical protein
MYDYQNPKSQDIEFCRRNGFSYLPAVDRNSIYKINPDGVERIVDFVELQCNPFDRLFDVNDIIKKFTAAGSDGVLFVMDKKKIKGVIHAVDYNHPFLSIELFRLFTYFERNLRRYLLARAENNDSFIDWVGSKDTDFYKKRYKELRPENPKDLSKQILKRSEMPPFQTFYLRELLEFVDSKPNDKVAPEEIYMISALRNYLMHSKDFVGLKNETDTEPVYDIVSLEKMANRINCFLDVYDRFDSKK